MGEILTRFQLQLVIKFYSLIQSTRLLRLSLHQFDTSLRKLLYRIKDLFYAYEKKVSRCPITVVFVYTSLMQFKMFLAM